MPLILLVEDNEMNRDMLSRRLARKGYTVEMALDGAQGVAMASEKNARPDFDGYESAGFGTAGKPRVCSRPTMRPKRFRLSL